jgi:helix-turn-helix protein
MRAAAALYRPDSDEDLTLAQLFQNLDLEESQESDDSMEDA